jgi:hypothetical protein
MRKLTVTETRALALCKAIKKGYVGAIAVEWKRSATWGSNPSIRFNGGKCCSVSGCGYDKLSTCLADVLRFLEPIDSEGYNKIWRTGGAGEHRAINVLASLGWLLTPISNGKTYDTYTIKRMED